MFLWSIYYNTTPQVFTFGIEVAQATVFVKHEYTAKLISRENEKYIRYVRCSSKIKTNKIKL